MATQQNASAAQVLSMDQDPMAKVAAILPILKESVTVIYIFTILLLFPDF